MLLEAKTTAFSPGAYIPLPLAMKPPSTTVVGQISQWLDEGMSEVEAVRCLDGEFTERVDNAAVVAFVSALRRGGVPDGCMVAKLKRRCWL